MVWIALGVACFIAVALYVGHSLWIAFWVTAENGDESLVLQCCNPCTSSVPSPSNSACAHRVKAEAAEVDLMRSIGPALHAFKLGYGDSQRLARQSIATSISSIEGVSNYGKCRRRNSEDR